MHARNTIIFATVIAGLFLGPEVLRLYPGVSLTVSWSYLPLVFIGCAVGLPLVLALLAASGRYKVMIWLWSVFGLLATLSVAIGVSAAARSMAVSGMDPGAIFFVAVGAGSLAGLGLVKLAIRRARAKNSA